MDVWLFKGSLNATYTDNFVLPSVDTGCSLNIVFFSKILKYIPDSGLSRFPLGVSVCTQWQVKQVELAELRKIATF